MDDGYLERASQRGFEATLAQVEKAIRDAGMTVFARIDHAAGARDVGMTMPPAIVFIFGNPRGGTLAMLAAPRAALDLPLRILVRQSAEGEVLLACHRIEPVLRQAGVPDQVANALGAAQAKVLEASLS